MQPQHQITKTNVFWLTVLKL